MRIYIQEKRMLSIYVNTDTPMSEEMSVALINFSVHESIKGGYSINRQKVIDFLLAECGERIAAEFTDDMLHPA